MVFTGDGDEFPIVIQVERRARTSSLLQPIHSWRRVFENGECPVDEIELYKKGANAMQVGGRHYKQLPIEPWDYIAANGLDFFEGNIVKYITRAGKSKNRDDLLKAQHYLVKLLEILPLNAKSDKQGLSRCSRETVLSPTLPQ